MKDYYEGNLEKAFLVTNDGDFDVLVSFLVEHNSLGRLICPDLKRASRLLKKVTPQQKLFDLKRVIHSITKKDKNS